MKAAIYNPYLDTLGGGERYSMAVATLLREKGYDVDVQWQDEQIRSRLSERFGIDLSTINFIRDIKKGDGYDLCFWVSDGSIPLLHSRKNILHFQVPFHGVEGKSIINRMKLIRINKVVSNSYFTKKVIDKEYGIKSIVIYPPVDINKIKPLKKKNIILYIGRFSELMQNKRQDVLIGVFKTMVDQGLKNWKLILAGGGEVGSDGFIERLRKMSQGYPVIFNISPKYGEVLKLYGHSKIFWSAAGYGESESKEPEKMEHFGITLVEAMSAGCVPVAYNGGGHKELIKNTINGFLWEKRSDLIKITKKLINKSSNDLSDIIRNCSLKYSYREFKSNLEKLI